MNVILEVAIGMVFLYLLLALVVTTVQELVASAFRLRAKHLYSAIAGMLSDTNREQGNKRAELLYAHPLFKNLTEVSAKIVDGRPHWLGRGLPSYVPDKTFALALVDILRQETSPTEVIGAAHVLSQADAAIERLPAGDLKQTMRLLLGDVGELAKGVDERSKLVSERIESWFDQRMSRASGWYKRSAQLWSLGIAFTLCILANADTVYVVKQLWNNSALRATVVASAQGYYAEKKAEHDDKEIAEEVNPRVAVQSQSDVLAAQLSELSQSSLPVGWRWQNESLCLPQAQQDTLAAVASAFKAAAPPTDSAGNTAPATCEAPSAPDIIFAVFGWCITALAVSLGSTFWFDMLGKALQLRGSGPPIGSTRRAPAAK